MFTAQSSDRVIAFKLHSFVVYDYDEKQKLTNIQALISETHLYGSSAPERLMQILQLVQGQMVKSQRIQVRATNFLPKQSMLAYQYLGFVTSPPISNTEVILTRNSVLNMTKCTYRIIWGKFGFSINFPGEVTDVKFYHSIRKFTNKIVSDMLLKEFEEKPSLSAAVSTVYWINNPIEKFQKTADKHDVKDKNVIFQFAIDVAARATHIPLCALTHGIVMRLKAKGKKHVDARGKTTADDTSNFIFETTLELIQNISVSIRKASPEITEYVGDCHECRLYCTKCFFPFGIKGTIFQVLYEAPYAILYHYGLELPNNGLRYDSSNDRFCASLPMHTSPENLGDSGIEIFKRQTAYVRCACGTDQNWKDNQEIFDNRKHLHNLSEAMRIDSAFTGDMKCRHYNTTAILFSLFDVMSHR